MRIAEVIQTDRRDSTGQSDAKLDRAYLTRPPLKNKMMRMRTFGRSKMRGLNSIIVDSRFGHWPHTLSSVAFSNSFIS